MIGYQLPLSSGAMHLDGNPIFLLDAYTSLVVYYARFAESIPYPPPSNSTQSPLDETA